MDGAARASAVAAAQGSLVGGNGVFYFVRAAARCADWPVWCAIDVLEALPQVEQAHPYLVGGTNPTADFAPVEPILTPTP